MEHIGDKESCGRLLTGLRHGAKLSTREAAKLSGVSASTIIAAEKGHRFPAMDTLMVLLRFYKVTATVGVEPVENGTL